MLSISIAGNVISYKKNQKKACLSRNWTSSLSSIISIRISFKNNVWTKLIAPRGFSNSNSARSDKPSIALDLVWTIFCVCNPWSPLSHCAFPIVRALSRLGGGGGGAWAMLQNKNELFQHRPLFKIMLDSQFGKTLSCLNLSILIWMKMVYFCGTSYDHLLRMKLTIGRRP